MENGAQRVFHELEVHQIELEMQNAELHRARNDLEAALADYTDLYDFAPVGYFSIDEAGAILEANLTGAALLGVERGRLIKSRFSLFVAPTSRPEFATFLEQAFSGLDDRTCEALIRNEGGRTFWAEFRASSAISQAGSRRWCRMAFADVSDRKKAADAQLRLDVLSETNLGLKREIDRREKLEKALQKSRRQQAVLLKQSRRMQEQLRHLSHQRLYAQEDERKRISRELHDVIAQTLVGINIRLAALSRDASGSPRGLKQRIARTQRLVEESVGVVHRFARELRPTALDDLGLLPALHAFMKDFTKQTGVRAHLTAYRAIEQLDGSRKTTLYRVAHEALTNVARHAAAERVDVTIRQDPNGISLLIVDDGKSFDVERAMHTRRGRHLGLLGMRERVEMVGGRLSIESAPGKGTTIRAEIPMPKERRAGRARPRPR